MKRPHTTLTLLLVAATTAAAGAPAAQATDDCLNAAVRAQNNSTSLPDCRAYELVTPDINHAKLYEQGAGLVAHDGEMLVYQAYDPPGHANAGQIYFNYVRARRDPVRGWSGIGLAPPLSTPVTGYWSFKSGGISADLSSTLQSSDQPLSGEDAVGSRNTFVGRPDGTYHLVASGAPGAALVVGTPDYSHVYFQPSFAQLPSDPASGRNSYVWSEDRGLRLIGILPGEVIAPNGANFVGASDDGKYVAFTADGKLYLRIDDAETVEVGASQRTVDPDPNPPAEPRLVKVTADGSKVLFTSSSELTNDANTGRTGGVSTDSGRDLYSYDVASGVLSDMTVSADPADAATGTNIQVDPFQAPIVRATRDGSHVYFVATGVLADGATPGHASLYVWHDGEIDFVAPADGMFSNANYRSPSYYIAPNGRHITFVSTDSLTGYDNSDPVTGQPHVQVFKATIGEGVECASCRADGTSPTADSALPISVWGIYREIRVMSDDGRRVFFHSTDAIVPQASAGQNQVFQYADGKASAISRLDGPPAYFVDASASGDDVFFQSYDDKLVPNPNAGDHAMFDARVGGGFPIAVNSRCAGAACRATVSPPSLPVAASLTFLGDDDLRDPGPAARVSVSKVKAITGPAGSLRVKVPGKGRLTVSGTGLQTRRSSLSKSRKVSVRLALTAKAAKALKKKRSLRTRVKVTFRDSAGRVSTAALSVTFKAAGAARKGR